MLNVEFKGRKLHFLVFTTFDADIKIILPELSKCLKIVE